MSQLAKSKSSLISQHYRSASSSNVGEGVPYENTIQKTESFDHLLPSEADVVVIGTLDQLITIPVSTSIIEFDLMTIRRW